MNIIHLESGEYPLTPGDVMRANPNISYPMPFELSDGYAWVTPVEPPKYDPITQKLTERPPKKTVGGTYHQFWMVEGLSDEKIEQNKQIAARQLFLAVQTEAQRRLDSFARERRYDGILSLTSYATSKNPKFQVEGQAGVDARDSFWAVLYQLEDDVRSGSRAMPTFEEAVAEVPELTWAPALA